MTTVKYNDKTLTLAQDAHISEDGTTYQAHATDSDDNQYLVFWDVLDDCDDDDESSMCNWQDFYVQEFGK